MNAMAKEQVTWRGDFRWELRQFILATLGKYPEGVTTTELFAHRGVQAGSFEASMLYDELMSLRVHSLIELNVRYPSLVLVNKYTPSQWLEWARERQKEEAR